MRTKIVYGKYLIADADTVVPSGAAYIEDDRIIETGTYAEIAGRHKADEQIGGADMMVIPGLVNAHGHGRGITDFQRGALDDTLEVWKFRRYPPVDSYWDTLWQIALLLESGVTTVMHNHTPARPAEAAAEMETLLGAYKESGIRTAFAPALSYTNTFVYGDNEAFIASLPSAARETAEKIAANSRIFSPAAYFAAVDYLTTRFDSDLIRVHHGPMAPQWVEEDVLSEIKTAADRANKMLFTHVQQTPHQYLYGLKRYGKTLVEWMDGKGLLGKNVVLGHCVWVTRSDIKLIARSGTSVTHHPSCNLRVRNGVAPVNEMLKSGVTVGIGMDDKEMGDDRDFLEETRVAAKLHRVPDYKPGSPCLGSREAFRMATEFGARCLGLETKIGALRPGMQADLTLLDYDAMTHPFTFPGHDPVEVLMQRGRKNHVRTVIAAGDVLLENGRHRRLDRENILRKLTESIPRDYAEKFAASVADFEPLRQAVKKWFGPWCGELEGMRKRPFYHLNDARR